MLIVIQIPILLILMIRQLKGNITRLTLNKSAAMNGLEVRLITLYKSLSGETVVGPIPNLQEEIYPCKPLPNVRQFKIKLLSPLHPIFKAWKLNKREYSPLIESDQYTNGQMNRYINHMFIRLNKSRSNEKKFWRIGLSLLKVSTSYQAACLNKVIPGWHRDYTYGEIIKTMESVIRILKSGATTIKYKRMWIDKSPGSTEKRPLGVPTLAWRIILHGLQNLLVVWLSPYQSKSQHGFWPERGTTTAWKELHTQAINKSNIYEFDLKKFFDKINLTYLRNVLHTTGIPYDVLTWLDGLNRSQPINQKDNPLDITWSSDEEEARDYYYDETNLTNWPTTSGAVQEWTEHWLQKKRSGPNESYEYYHGLPQGSPCSPILSSAVLNWTLLLPRHTSHVTQYADDGIIHSNSEIIPYHLLHQPWYTGIEQNIAKSRWIKKSGEWLTSLKFLGLKYTNATLLTTPRPLEELTQGGLMESCTKQGNQVEFTKLRMINEAELYDREKSQPIYEYIESQERYLTSAEYENYGLKKSKHKTFIDWFRTKYIGYIHSRLYQGTFTQTDIQQDFSYKFQHYSWSHLESLRGPNALHDGISGIKLDIFNSSSIACRALSNRLRAYRRGELTPWK